MRTKNPRLFGKEDDNSVLKMLGVLRMDDEGTLRPTLAGLLALGRYPQQFFPHVWEYPSEALREAIVNALIHRDLSPGSRGTQVQVEMYPDRLRILNPGGLFGAVDLSRLGEQGVSSSRNSWLLKILEDVAIPGEDRTVCENRGSGIRTMRRELAKANMSPPDFCDRATAFEVTMPNHTLFDESTLRWLSVFGSELKDTQRTALALMRRGEILDNARYRAATGILDSRMATTELQDLVARELVEQKGIRGGARYTLSSYAMSLDEHETEERNASPKRRRQIIDILHVHGELSKSEVSALLNINPKTVEYWLGKLKKEGEIQFSKPNAKRGGKNVRYRLSSQAKISGLSDTD